MNLQTLEGCVTRNQIDNHNTADVIDYAALYVMAKITHAARKKLYWYLDPRIQTVSVAVRIKLQIRAFRGVKITGIQL